MTASNLAICFAPSLFHVYGVHATAAGAGAPVSLTVNGTSSSSPRRDLAGKHAASVSCRLPVDSELVEQKASLDCLTFMIVNVSQLFTVRSHCSAQLTSS